MNIVALLLAILSCQSIRKLEPAAMVLNLTNYNLLDLYTTIRFGDTTYFLKVDTGANFTTLASSTQAICHTENRFTCNPDTCTKAENEITVEYMSGLTMTGNFAYDDFVLGRQSITDMKFLLTTSEVGFDYYPYDGILGLNIPSFFKDRSGLMFDLVDKGIVPLKQIGIYLSSVANDATSQITLGGYDTTKANATNTKWLPISSNNHWEVSLTGYKIGTSVTMKNYTFLFSTGLFYTYIPTDVYVEYILAVRKKYSSCEYYMHSAQFGCVVSSLNDMDGFPLLSILVGKEVVTLTRSQLVYSFQVDKTFVAIILINQIEGDVWMAGTSIMTNRYMVFNAENMTIGLSNTKGKIGCGIILVILLCFI